MENYLSGIDSVVGVRRNIARISDVLGADSKPPPFAQQSQGLDTALEKTPVQSIENKSSVDKFKDFLKNAGSLQDRRDVPDGVQTLVGGALGAALWSEHRILGLIGGASLGRNIPALLSAENRIYAYRNMTTTGSAVLGSLLLKGSPILGFIVGGVAGGAFAYYRGWK